MRRARAGAIVVALLVALLVALAPRAADACAGCRNPSLPITRLSNVELAPGQLRATALLTATAVNVVHQAGCADPANCAEVPAQPLFLHDQNLYPGEIRAVAELGLSARWGIEAQLPFRVVRTTIHYTTLDGDPYAPLDPDVHHRDETVAGIGDPWLLARYGTDFAGLLVTARAGTSLPLGRTEANPFLLGDVGLRHQHIQMGSGTFDPVFSLDASRGFGRVHGSAYVQGQFTLYENRHGFRGGQRFFTGFSAGTRLWGDLVGSLGPDLLYEGPERWDGAIRQDGNLGRTEVLASATLTQRFGETRLSLIVRVPVFRYIVVGDEPTGRLSSPVLLSLMATRTF